MIKYQARVTEIGPLVDEFIEHGILVLFGQDAPEELAEFSIIHDGHELVEPLQVGDQVFLGEESFTILALGEVASTNFASLGHLILKFNGLDTPEMPGDVCVEKKPIPEITPGVVIRVEGSQGPCPKRM
jgi:PTS system glucitol/sorbitol-specific IIA component